VLAFAADWQSTFRLRRVCEQQFFRRRIGT